VAQLTSDYDLASASELPYRYERLAPRDMP
jgi:hypothetical protein